MQKAYDTRCSQAVSDPSTNRARRCLTCQIRRDGVLSTWYGRRQEMCTLLYTTTQLSVTLDSRSVDWLIDYWGLLLIVAVLYVRLIVCKSVCVQCCSLEFIFDSHSSIFILKYTFLIQHGHHNDKKKQQNLNFLAAKPELSSNFQKFP